MVGVVGVGVEDGTVTLTIVVVITVTVTPTTIAPITDRASVFGSAFKYPPQREVIDQGARFGRRPFWPLHFEDQADAAPHGTVGVSNSSRTATAILALFFLCEPSRLRRRPSACNAACEEAPSGQRHSHGVLPYWKAADKDGRSVIHRKSPVLSTGHPFGMTLGCALVSRHFPSHATIEGTSACDAA